MRLVSRKLSDTHKLAEKIAARIIKSGPHQKHARVVALVGDLGAGKTVFAQGFAKALGVKRHLSSPTFLIFRIYPLATLNFKLLFHVDAYRIDDAGELSVIDLDKILADPRNIALIEWADKIRPLLPKKYIEVKLKVAGENNRKIDIRL